MKPISILLIVLFCIPSCTKKEAPTECVVTPRDGLNLRDKPNSKGSVIVTMPKGSKVTIVEQTDVQELIGNINGSWIKVRWNGKTGYAFNHFLNCQSKEETPQGCYPIMPSRELCYSRDFVEMLSKKYQKQLMLTGKIPLSIDILKQTPNIFPGSGMFIITKDRVIEKTVHSIILRSTEIGPTIVFQFEKEQDNHIPDSFYLERNDLTRTGADVPSIMTFQEVNDPSKEQKLLNSLLSLRQMWYWTGKRIIFNNVNEVRNYYKISLLNLTHPTINNRINVLKFTNEYYQYIAIAIDDRISWEDHGQLLTAFAYNKSAYIGVRRWTPHSEDIARCVLEVKHGNLKMLSCSSY